MAEYPTPIETLQKLKGKQVYVELKNRKSVEGKLVAFDLYTNITLETEHGTRFIQGGLVNTLSGKNHSPQDTPA